MKSAQLVCNVLFVFMLLFLYKPNTVEAQAEISMSDYGTKPLIGMATVQEVERNDLEYVAGEVLTSSVRVSNTKGTPLKILIVWEILNNDHQLVNKKSQMMYLKSGEKRIETLKWTISTPMVSGMYFSKVYGIIPPDSFEDLPIFLTDPSEQSSTKAFQIINGLDDFNQFDSTMWQKSSHTLGRSKLREDLIHIEKGLLKLKLQANNFYGAEIQSINTMGFGQYEGKMRLPFAPSSITGFFLYESPDYYYEIDIEIVNDTSGKYYLTTYSDGKMSNTYEGNLGFDPTAAYHLYKIDYKAGSVAFYIDNQFVKRWRTQIPQKPMKLMLNVWYPTWMDGQALKKDTELSVDWIKY